MKRITLLLILMFTANTLFAQYIMVRDNDGDVQYQKITSTQKITFGVPPAFDICGDIVVYEGKYYGTVQVGNQCWFKENLNVGTMISSNASGDNQINNYSTNSVIEKYCYNNDESNCDTYGGLYQWDELMEYETNGTQGLCPTGWHVPSITELTTLKDAVGGSGNALKAIGQGTGSGMGNNTSGFSALISGLRNSGDGSFSYLTKYNYFWSSTKDGNELAFYMYMSDSWDGANTTLDATHQFKGYSVRCLMD